jgi:GAF domain-containing protein
MPADRTAPPDHSDAATDLAQHLADIAAVMMVPSSMAGTEDQIAALAVSLLDDCDVAAVCGPSATTGVVTELATQLDLLQVDLGEGPCRDALAGSDSIYVADLDEDSRWPSFAPAALELGVRSVLAYRLSAEGSTVGALQLFGHLPGAFNAHERAQGLVFATFAGTAIALARGREQDVAARENLGQALASREVIGQAQGILMERERITADQAFDLLRRASQHLNVKLRAIAQQLVDTGRVEG